MTVLLSALAFIVLLSVLILIHEWGHFAAARKSGVIVEEFGFGLPPLMRVLFTWRGTKFSLNWIPFGGFVRLKGENAVDITEHTAPGSFGSASILQRTVILCAGVFMNFLLALVILIFGFSYGRWIPTYDSIQEMESAAERGLLNLQFGVRIEQLTLGEGAALAGVPNHSIIAAIDGQPVKYLEDVQRLEQGKQQVVFTLKVGEEFREEVQKTVTLDENSKAGMVVAIHIIEASGTRRSVPTATVLALRESWALMKQTAIGMADLFLSLAQTGSVPEGITGIVGIAQMTHSSVQQGFLTYLRLVALLSLSLAALNILPFPALDGGRLIFVLAEAIGRRPVNRKFELATNGVGFLILISLILLITYHDIVNLIF